MMLGNSLQWIDQHPSTYWITATFFTLLVIAAAVHALRPGARPSGRWLYPVLLLLLLVSWRWPYLLFAREFNPDESQYIAGALTLRHDPLFWRSVDGMTAGPLVYYALVPWTLFGPHLGFLTARITGLLLIWLALVILYRTLREHYGEGTARTGMLPGALLLASVGSEELNHYSSELFSLPLTALGFALLTRPKLTVAAGSRPWLILGVVAGLHAWVKLQTGPIGALLVVVGGWLIATNPGASTRAKMKCAGWLVGGALLPALVVNLVTWLGGVWTDFYLSYIAQNLFYAGETQPQPWIPPNVANLRPVLISAGLALATPALLGGLAWSLGRRPSRLLLISTALVGAAFFCVLFPGRSYLHYTMLLAVPIIALSTVAVGECCRAPRRRFAAITALVVVLSGASGLLAARLFSPPPPSLGRLMAQLGNTHSEVDAVLAAITKPGEKLAVWGYQNEPFVKTGLIQGTRAAFSYWSIRKTPLIDYHRRTFLADFLRNQPEVFLDTVGPNAFFFRDRATLAHETFPALAEVIARDYVLLVDLGFGRVYARRNLMESRNVPLSAIRRAIQECRPRREITLNYSPVDLGLQVGTHYWIGRRVALLLLPPAEGNWVLTGDEREVLFDCGYHPASLAQSEGNGTEFFVELIAPDGVKRQLLRFLLNPAHVPADRAVRTRRVTLPPFAPGSRLVIRTEAGFDDYNAWDWAYIDRLRFLRSPNYNFRQFPGFNRMPDNVRSPLSTLVQVDGLNTIMLHARSDLTFALKGPERRFRVTYGFVESAYQGGGRTDGARFIVNLLRPDGTVQEIASRHLKPFTQENDRGPQTFDFGLPDFAPGSALGIVIDDAGNPAFDWTYLTDLQID